MYLFNNHIFLVIHSLCMGDHAHDIMYMEAMAAAEEAKTLAEAEMQ
jgi:hypothetical protein